jgi:PAS domain S-box-containing protein
MESRAGIDALFLHASEGILVLNKMGEIERANPSCDRLFGYQSGELIGKKIEALIPKRLAEKHKSHRENYSQNPHARSMGAGLELYGLRKDGSELPVEISLSPYTTEDGQFVIAFIVDITIRKQAEEKLKNYSIELEKQVRNRTLILEEAIQELEKTKRNLNSALEKEKDLNELKSRFVSMASHEFRTPLTTMLSSLSLVTKYGELNDIVNQSKHVGKIKASINNLTDILNDFLSISRLEEGKLEFMPESIDLKQYVEEIVAEMQLMAGKNQGLICQHIGHQVAKIDKKMLKHIFFNLISNAIKFSPEGGDILVKVSVEDKMIQIEVLDQGIGISDEDQKHLFERFFRGHNATHIQGTELGLNLVARYAELMNANLKIESKENQGAKFTIIIPQ